MNFILNIDVRYLFLGFILLHTLCDALVDAYSRNVISNLHKLIDALIIDNKIPKWDGHDLDTARIVGENNWHIIKTISRLSLLIAGGLITLVILSKGLLYAFFVSSSPILGLMAVWQVLYNISRFQIITEPYILNLWKFTLGYVNKQYLISRQNMGLAFMIMISISMFMIYLVY